MMLVNVVLGAAAAGMANAAMDCSLGLATLARFVKDDSDDRPLVQISDLDEIDLGNFTGTGSMTGSDNV